MFSKKATKVEKSRCQKVKILSIFVAFLENMNFKGLIIGFGPKGMTGRMCDIVR